MSKLRAPIREVLDDRLPEPEVQRIWRELRKRSSRRGSAAWSRPLRAAAAFFPRRAPRAWILPLMAGVTLLMLSLAGWLGLRGPEAEGPIAIAGADALSPRRVLDGDLASVLPLSDGSRIQLAAATRLRVLENSDRAFELRLDAGRGEFDVKPGGPRRWRIESGDLSVEVVGTSFVVQRDARGVSVDVRHGVVKVRSTRIQGGARRLAAGERLDLPVEQAPAAAPRTEGAKSSPPAVHEALQPEAATPAQPAATSRLRSTQEKGPATARPEGVDPSALLRSADQARRNGRVAHAEALLERVRAGWPGTPHAALASLTLARMRIASAPELAVRDLGSALAAELPQSLREDAMARLVEAHARAGQLELARTAAQAYLQAFPGGRRTAEIERWAQLP